MNSYPKPTPEIKCLECGTEGTVDGSDFCNFSVSANSDESTMVFMCKRCGKPIIISRDCVAASPDPLFQTIGMLGTTRGMIQPNDHDPPVAKVILKGQDGTQTVVRSGTLTVRVPDPRTGELRPLTIGIGREPEFLLSCGTYRDYPLPEPVDRVFTLALKAMDPPDLGDEVQFWLRPIQDSNGRYSSIRVAATTSSPEVLSENQVNVLCHLFAVPDMSRYAPWLGQMIEAIEQTAEGDLETAVLDYARACEVFVEDFLRQSMRLVKSLDDSYVGQVMEMRDVGLRVTSLLPLLTADPRGYNDAQKAWKQNVQTIRNRRIAHTPRGINSRECQEAHDSAYWFIKAVQNQCLFDAGKTWDYWARPTTKSRPEQRKGPGSKSA